MEVPLYWDRPGGPEISLAVIRRPAGKSGEHIGSMFVNPGGPGQSGVDLVKGPAGAEFDAIGQGRFDIASWDPRGTNDSTPVRCFEDERNLERLWEGASIPIRTKSRASSGAGPRPSRAAAARSVAHSLRHISTADTVRDLDHLRQLVGDQQLTYFGLSYGTFL